MENTFITQNFYKLNQENEHKLFHPDTQGLKINSISVKKENYEDLLDNYIIFCANEENLKIPIKLMSLLNKPTELKNEIIINFNWDFFFEGKYNFIFFNNYTYFTLEKKINYEIKLYLSLLQDRFKYFSKMIGLQIRFKNFVLVKNKKELLFDNSNKPKNFFIQSDKTINYLKIEFLSEYKQPYTELDEYYLSKITPELGENFKFINLNKILNNQYNYILDKEIFIYKLKYEEDECYIPESIRIKLDFESDFYLLKYDLISFSNRFCLI